MDFLHELNVKWFEAMPSWGDEEEAGMDKGICQVTSLNLSLIDKDNDNDKDKDEDVEEADMDKGIRQVTSLNLKFKYEKIR